ncbi:hypothetical protein L0F63_001232 [Massospora cicadina]|nr:hypothetical protein L0F63_001232 [Massospora cicadina]
MESQTTLLFNSPDESDDEVEEQEVLLDNKLFQFFPYLAKHLAFTEAKKLARKIFASLQGNRRFILLKDFYQIFPDEAEAQKAFNLFDQDQNGDISRREMRERITQIYRERKDLTLALNDTSQAVGKLDGMLLHPYDAGDRCYIEKEKSPCSEGRTFGYTLHSYFEIDFETPRDKFLALKEQVNKYLKEEESREFFPDPVMGIEGVVPGTNKLKVYISLDHKSNWQEGWRRWARKTRFMLALKEICLNLEIKFTPLPQKVELITSNSLAPMPSSEIHQ